jgi:hypothetical protein
VSNVALSSSGVAAVGRKAGRSDALDLAIVPDAYVPKIESHYNKTKVFLPRRLLNELPRHEIDALAGIQFAMAGERADAVEVSWGALCYGFAAGFLIEHLGLGADGRWGAFLLALTAEVIAVKVVWSHLQLRTARRSIALVGDSGDLSFGNGQIAEIRGTSSGSVFEETGGRRGVFCGSTAGVFGRGACGGGG